MLVNGRPLPVALAGMYEDETTRSLVTRTLSWGLAYSARSLSPLARRPIGLPQHRESRHDQPHSTQTYSMLRILAPHRARPSSCTPPGLVLGRRPVKGSPQSLPPRSTQPAHHQQVGMNSKSHNGTDPRCQLIPARRRERRARRVPSCSRLPHRR